MKIFDTTFLVDLIKGDKGAAKKAKEIDEQGAEAELVRFEIMPYIYEVAKTATEIDAQLALNEQTISFSDTILAATAKHYKLTLVTRNTEHFSRIPNLQIETY